jgi:hypothetical protein
MDSPQDILRSTMSLVARAEQARHKSDALTRESSSLLNERQELIRNKVKSKELQVGVTYIVGDFAVTVSEVQEKNRSYDKHPSPKFYTVSESPLAPNALSPVAAENT